MRNPTFKPLSLILALGIAVYPLCAERSDSMRALADRAVADAHQAVEQARASMQSARKSIAKLDADSDLVHKVKQVVESASASWDEALAALKTAKEAAEKVKKTRDQTEAEKHLLRARAASNLARAGAKLVQTNLCFVRAVDSDHTEVLEIVNQAIREAENTFEQMKLNQQPLGELLSVK
jgi:hypothetical protein